jgi:cell wall-associated NlpC family hydrolase
MVAKANPRSAQDAVNYGLSCIGGPTIWHGLCDHFVAECYGWGASGYGSALQQWFAMPQHNSDQNPPLGALVFWKSLPYGHVALSCGDGTVLSTDIDIPGGVSRVPLSTIGSKWGIAYLGWTPAIFNGSGFAPDLPLGGTAAPDGGSLTTQSVLGSTPIPTGGYTSILSNIGSLSFWTRVAVGAIGVLLIIVGIVIMYGKSNLPIPIPIPG